MKRHLLLFVFALLLSSTTFSQTFTDDFESYAAGDYLGANSDDWTTWSGTTGNSEDVQVTDADAYSGSNSIFFSSTAASGGPQDVVLFFGGSKITSGFLSMGTAMKVDGGAYFNLQGEVAIGTTWAINFDFSGGTCQVYNNSETVLTFPYPENEWFELRMDMNFDANKWQVFMNDDCQGSFSNATNFVASIDIFPLTGHSFYMDDFTYTYDENAPTITNDAGVVLTTDFQNGLSGNTTPITGEIQNKGSETITSFTVELDIAGTMVEFSMSELMLSEGESFSFDVDDAFEITDGTSTVSATITDVNEGSFVDDDICNDRFALDITGRTAADHKKVVVEEATGTWCGWCPRGTVALEYMSWKYDDRFIGIAVHNGDPMVDTDYDDGLNATAFPNARVNRGSWVDPGAIEVPFLEDIVEAPLAILENGALYDENTRELKISLALSALQSFTPIHRIAVAITEDGVTGTGSGYNQVNYYSSASQNIDLFSLDGTNWKNLPASVPASTLVYDHVARALLTPFAGMVGSFDGQVQMGDEVVWNFTYTIPEDFNAENMHIVTMLVTPFNTIDNAESTTIAEAVENGYRELTSNEDIIIDNTINVYPNPTVDYATISMNLVESTDLSVEIIDPIGKVVLSKTFTNQVGYFNTNLNTQSFTAGNYVIKIMAGNQIQTKTLSVVK